MAQSFEPTGAIPFSEQVGLVLRAYRREHDLSQRDLAEAVSVSQPTIARVERAAHTCSLSTVLGLLAETRHGLGVVDATGELVTRWDSTDRVARDRAGRYFPAHREVRWVDTGEMAPTWWVLREYFGRECGPQPRWTAEGSVRPATTQYGRPPRPRAPGEEPRWL